MTNNPITDARPGFAEISTHAIKRWRLLVLCCAGLLLLTSLAWRDIPRLEEPRVEPTDAMVTLAYPGASPEDVETQVVKIVEESLYAMDRVEYVESSALPNVGTFHIKFEDGVNMNVAVEQIRGKVQGKKKDLPAGVHDPEVFKFTTATTPQMVLAVTGYRSDENLTVAAKRIKSQLATIPGVANIDLRGEQKRAVRIRLDTLKLAAHHLSVNQVVQQIQLTNVRIPAGELRLSPLLTTLQVDQEFKSAADVLKLPLTFSSDERGTTHMISLGDVAEVREEARTPAQRFLYGAQPAVGLELRFRAEENAVAVGERVRKQLKEVERNLPQGVSVRIAHDQPQWIAHSVHNFLESLLEGIALVMVIISLGMGWRAAIVVAGVLPLAIAGAVLGLYLCGFALEQLSISGLIIALGLLVDDAVVVTESIKIMLDRGLSPVRAAVYGTARVFWANNGTTAVACASFLPLFLLVGGTGQYIKGMPTAVVLSLVTSLLVAQLVTPWVATLVLRASPEVRPIPDHEPFDRRRDSLEADDEEHNPVLRWLRALYGRQIGRIVENPVKVIVAATVLLIASLSLLPRIGFQFLSQSRQARAVCQPGSSAGCRQRDHREEASREHARHQGKSGDSGYVGDGWCRLSGDLCRPRRASGEQRLRRHPGAPAHQRTHGGHGAAAPPGAATRSGSALSDRGTVLRSASHPPRS